MNKRLSNTCRHFWTNVFARNEFINTIKKGNGNESVIYSEEEEEKFKTTVLPEWPLSMAYREGRDRKSNKTGREEIHVGRAKQLWSGA